jgi:hypothetical protein
MWALTTDGTITLDATSLEFTRDNAGPITRVAEQVFTMTGDDMTEEFSFNHNWNTMNVTHEIFDSAGHTVLAEFTRVSANAVKVKLGVPLEAGDDLKLIVRAQIEPV